MTEAEWRTCNDPRAMLGVVSGASSDRKLILFSAHHWITDQAADEEWYQEAELMTDEVINGVTPLSQLICHSLDFDFSRHTPTPTWWAEVVARERPGQPPRAHPLMANSIRCIFDNPFHPVTVDPRWRSETVTALAAGIYAERAFDRMPILADALEEAGCDNADMLAHCRGDGPHVRGCWVVDLVLGKS